jgi:predicted protein tyrosine phosphatase
MNAEQRIALARAHKNNYYNYTEPSNVIEGRIWVGSMDDAKNTEWLTAHKITHIVNCAYFIQNKTNVQNILVLDAKDTMDYSILELHLPSVIEFCDNAFQNPDARILFHCIAGVNRSPTLAIAYSILKFQTDMPRIERFANIFENLMKIRPVILDNEDFYQQLLGFARA